jgi:hypothetical protein
MPSGTGPVVVEERRGLLGLRKNKECTSCDCGSGEVVNSGKPVESVVVDKQPRQGLLSRWLHHDDTEVPLPPATPVQTVTIPLPTPGPDVAKAPPTNYRESWGQVEPWRPSTGDQAASRKSAKSSTGDASSQQVSDPVKNPEWYHRQALAELERKSALTGKGGDLVGMASVTAAGVSRMPPGLAGMPSPGPMGAPPLPPDPFRTTRMPRYPSGPGLRFDQGIPADMANAFTPGGTARPIPADFGSVHYPANAWSMPSSDPYVTAAMASQSGQPIAQPNAFLFPGMPSAMHGPMPGVFPSMVGMPPGYGVRQPLMQPPPQQMVMPASQSRAPAQDSSSALPERATPEQLVAILKTALYPSQREYAAGCLAAQDWKTQPQVLDAILAGAKDDPAASVRAGCVRALAQMKANTPAAVALMESLNVDTDPRVRQAAADALATLGVPAVTDTGVRRAGAEK